MNFVQALTLPNCKPLPPEMPELATFEGHMLGLWVYPCKLAASGRLVKESRFYGPEVALIQQAHARHHITCDERNLCGFDMKVDNASQVYEVSCNH